MTAFSRARLGCPGKRRNRTDKLIIFDWSNTLVNETSLDDDLCDFLGDGQRESLRTYLDRLQSNGDHLWYDYKHLAEYCGKDWQDVVRFHRDPARAHQKFALQQKNMKLDMLDALGDDDLRAVSARCDVLLKQHNTERKDKALSEARATLAAVGLTLKDLARKSPVKSKGPVYHSGRRYQNPSNQGPA